jgi:predicted GH43/DUF377 family glycosyl hydrolase
MKDGCADVEMRHHDLWLAADPSRVVLRPFSISSEPRHTSYGMMTRAERIVRQVLELTPEAVETELERVDYDFHGRHWQTHAIFLNRFRQMKGMMDGLEDVDEPRAKLIGAYFSHEYSYAAAAIMNPSIVPHPDQSGCVNGSVKFVMSLRTVGEGHISSISFREGVAFSDGGFSLWPEPSFALAAQPEKMDGDGGPVTVHRHESAPLSGNVIFPVTRAQRNGLEDLRLVQFQDEDGKRPYYGTYTAYSGSEVSCEMMTTEKFAAFDLRPMRGAAASHKGLALFPKRIGGDYAAIGRLDSESLYYLHSSDRFRWNYGRVIMTPKFPWELVQLGNCGSPIEIDEGWLLLTHGVGAMRQYSIGAALLDKDQPWKVLARSELPFIAPINETREGYVPNVVYTCGGMKVGDGLLIPYAVADSTVKFVTVKVKDLLKGLK